MDVKTKTVHFYVQRFSTFSEAPAVIIPWEVERLNEGGAMNLASGIFTVPLNGIYHFEFSGLKAESATDFSVFLDVNGVGIASAGTNYGSNTGTFEGYSLTASLRLKAGDRMNLFNDVGSVLYDNGFYKNHFTGWLVEEDLSTVA